MGPTSFFLHVHHSDVKPCFSIQLRAYLNRKISLYDHRRHPLYTHLLSENDSQNHGYWILCLFSSCPSHLEGILLLRVVIWTVTEWLIYIGSGSIILENSSISPSQWEYAQPNFSEPLGTPKQKTTNKGLLVSKVTTIAVVDAGCVPSKRPHFAHGPAPMALQMHLTCEGGPYRHRFMAERCPTRPRYSLDIYFHHMTVTPKVVVSWLLLCTGLPLNA